MKRLLGCVLAGAVLTLCLPTLALAGHLVCGQTVTEDVKLDDDLNCHGISLHGLIVGADGVVLTVPILDGCMTKSTGIVNIIDSLEISPGVLEHLGSLIIRRSILVVLSSFDVFFQPISSNLVLYPAGFLIVSLGPVTERFIEVGFASQTILFSLIM